MNDDLRHRLLGAPRDPGCEASFELLDQYIEALLRGEDVAQLYPQVVAHLSSCVACREDAEGMIAAARLETLPDPPK